MQIAHITLWLTNFHSIPKRDVTPAEFLILKKMHAVHDGRIENVQLVGDIKRTSAEELERLLSIYHHKYVNEKEGAFPGGAPTLPMKFEDLPEPPDITPYVEPPTEPPITKSTAAQSYDPEAAASED